MNTFQKIILTILTGIGMTIHASSIYTIGSDAADSFETEEDIINITKQGIGITTLQNTHAIGSINITEGTLLVDETADLGGAQVEFNGGTLEVAGNIDTGALALTNNGTLKVDEACIANLSADTTQTNTLTKTGPGTLLVNSDRHSSTTPITVSVGILEVTASGKLPTAAVNVGGNGGNGTLLLERSTEGTAPGAMHINSGGTLKTTVAIPATGVANTFSGGLTFHSGAVLYLGGDWAQNITVEP